MEDQITEAGRMCEGINLNLYSATLYREKFDDPTVSEKFVEYYVAADIRDVMDCLSDEFDDDGVEVNAVAREVPILAILKPNYVKEEEFDE